MSNNISLSQTEIKEWLNWFYKNVDASSRYEDIGWLSIQYEFEEETREVAYIPSGENVFVYSLMQIALQDEIKKQGWLFDLTTYSVLPVRASIRDGDKRALSNKGGRTILEAMMKAFREAWEVTHGN